MKIAIKGDSTVIGYEESDFNREIEPGIRDSDEIDNGGELMVCTEDGKCSSSSRVPRDRRICK
jgi:hypothetical protein